MAQYHHLYPSRSWHRHESAHVRPSLMFTTAHAKNASFHEAFYGKHAPSLSEMTLASVYEPRSIPCPSPSRTFPAEETYAPFLGPSNQGFPFWFSYRFTVISCVFHQPVAAPHGTPHISVGWTTTTNMTSRCMPWLWLCRSIYKKLRILVVQHSQITGAPCHINRQASCY